MRTLITGATGLIGARLCAQRPGAVVLTRDPGRAARGLPGIEAHGWEPADGPPPPAALAGVDVVFNLAGEPVAGGRWTADRKRRIRDSRILGTQNLVAGLAALPRPPRVLVSASAVGVYGDRGDEELDETAAPGAGFLAEVCVDWERAALAAERLGVRVVLVRTGIVLAADGGALGRMLTAFRLGAGGRLGSGRQWMPWIHVDDVIGLLLHASHSDAIRGPMNAVAPRPVTNADFTRALGRAVRRPALLPVPAVALRLAFGEMSAILTASQRAVPRVAERTGYAFAHAQLEDALDAVIAAEALRSRPASIRKC